MSSESRMKEMNVMLADEDFPRVEMIENSPLPELKAVEDVFPNEVEEGEIKENDEAVQEERLKSSTNEIEERQADVTSMVLADERRILLVDPEKYIYPPAFRYWPILNLLDLGFIMQIRMVMVYGEGNKALIVTKNKKVYFLDYNKDDHFSTGKTLYPKQLELPLQTNIKTVACSLHFVNVLFETGEVYFWRHSSRTLEDLPSPSKTHYTPARVNGLDNKYIVDIACGVSHCLALTQDGQVYAWGKNDWGQIGNGNSSDTDVCGPTQVEFKGEKIVHIACGAHFNMVVTDTDKVYGWGDNKYRQIPNDCIYYKIVLSFYVSPQEITTILAHNIKKVSCGFYHTLALTDEGKIFTWGMNNYGQIGTNYNAKISPYPMIVNMPELVMDITAYGYLNVAVDIYKTVYVWGDCFGQHITFPLRTKFSGIQDAFAFSKLKVMCKPLIVSDSDLEGILNIFNSLEVDVPRVEFGDPTTHNIIMKINEDFFPQEEEVENIFPDSQMIGNSSLPELKAVEDVFSNKIEDGEIEENDETVQEERSKSSTNEVNVMLEDEALPKEEMVQRILAEMTSVPELITLERFSTEDEEEQVEENDKSVQEERSKSRTNEMDVMLEDEALPKEEMVQRILAEMTSVPELITLERFSTEDEEEQVEENDKSVQEERSKSRTNEMDVMLEDEALPKEEMVQRILAEMTSVPELITLERFSTEDEEEQVEENDKSVQEERSKSRTNEMDVMLEDEALPKEEMVQRFLAEMTYVPELITLEGFSTEDEEEQVEENDKSVQEERSKSRTNEMDVMLTDERRILLIDFEKYIYPRAFRNWPILNLLDLEFIMQIRMVMVYGGGNKALIMTKNKKVYTLDYNRYDHFSTGKTLYPKQLKLPLQTNIKTVACSSHFVYVLFENGEVYFWKHNECIFNDGSFSSKTDYKPARVPGLNDKCVVDIACGSSHCLALTEDGQVYAWGKNDWGQIGNGDLSNTGVCGPTQVELKGEKIVHIACGANFNMVVTDTDKVYGWGDNKYRQIPNDRIHNKIVLSFYESPQEITTVLGQKIKKVSCGIGHILALTDEGKIYAWGRNRNRQIGINSDLPRCSHPMTVNIPESVKDIAAYGNLSVALSNNEMVYVWGECFGQNIKVPLPTKLSGIQDAFVFSKLKVMSKPFIVSDSDVNGILSIFEFIDKAYLPGMQFDDSTTSDIMIKIGKGRIFVHESILKTRSQYFKNKFDERDWIENNKRSEGLPIYNVPDIFSYVVYKSYIQYLYTGKVDLSSTKILELMILAEKYNEIKLKKECLGIIEHEQ